MLRRTELFRQVGSFGLIGILATLVHAAVFSATASLGLAVDLANLVAFFCALPVSYFGNARLTFRVAPDWRMAARFIGMSLLGFGLNALNVRLVAAYGLPWAASLPGMVLVVPVLSFAVSRLWVYTRRPSA